MHQVVSEVTFALSPLSVSPSIIINQSLQQQQKNPIKIKPQIRHKNEQSSKSVLGVFPVIPSTSALKGPRGES